jgi:7,8-dihydroneopterin aldolase/epimerase/oxygenase
MNGDDDPRAGNGDDELKADEASSAEGPDEQDGGAELEGAELEGEDWVEELERGRVERGRSLEEESEEAGEEDEDEEEEHERGVESVTIEITGLSLYTHHGVSEAEREVGQRLMFDLRLELGETDATLTDRVEDTVDYGEVCQLVALIAQQRSHRTLERLCSTIVDRLLADYELEAVWVKATKPEPPIPLTVEEVSVEVWREAEE